MDTTFETMLLPDSNEQVAAQHNTGPAFIVANTREMQIDEIRDKHIIPVYPVTNEPLISHYQLIEAMVDLAHRVFPHERINAPVVRVSHPIKGRIPDAKHKKASELQPWEETLYYERMAFVVEIPSISATVGGNPVSLSVGAVKAYNLDNVYSRRNHLGQQFKLFIGFQNKVCCNMCVSTDGFLREARIQSPQQLRSAIYQLLSGFGIDESLHSFMGMERYHLSEKQFAQVMGRTRMYKHMPEGDRLGIPPMLLGDQQLGMVVKNYYEDDNFCRSADGAVSLWRMHNLLTGANKSTYIDQFLDRAVNATDFVDELTKDLTGSKQSWYMG